MGSTICKEFYNVVEYFSSLYYLYSIVKVLVGLHGLNINCYSKINDPGITNGK